MGKLIVLEGGDGAGKSTQIELIKNHFEKNEVTYKFLHFPMYGDNEFSEVISKFLRGEFGKSDEVNPYFVANIYAMDQFLFAPKLAKYLDEYDVVLLDRYVFSNIAYQGAKYPLLSKESKDIMIWIERFQFEFLSMPVPDLSLFLDVPTEILEERLDLRRKSENREYLQGKEDIHEADMELQKRVVENYKNYFERQHPRNNFHVVKTAVLSGDMGDTHWFLHSPQTILESYKEYMYDVIHEGDVEELFEDDQEIEMILDNGGI